MRKWLLLVPVLLLVGSTPLQKHPRIFIQGRLPAFPWKDRLDGLKASPAGLALHWRYTGEESSAKRCLAELKKMRADTGYGLYVYGPVLYLPIAYDWLYDWRGFSPEDKQLIEQKIIRTADDCLKFLKGKGDHVFHTSAPRAVMGIGLAAIVLDGKKAAEYMAFTREYLEETYLPAMKYLDGGAVAGMSYGVVEGFAPLCYLLAALKSRGIDYYKKEKWLETRLHYLLDSLLPDHTFVRWGDIVGGSRASTREEIRPVIDMLSHGVDSAEGYSFSAQIEKRWPRRRGYHDTVMWSAPFFAKPVKSGVSRRPLASLYGKNSIGQAFLRSGWGPDDSVIFFKCGDYYDNHGHFDQGSFTIYRKEHLAVDAFGYTSTNADHRNKYGKHIIAHNGLVIGNGDRAGCQREINSQTSQDLADHFQKMKSRRMETGSITAWKVEKSHVYLAADVTAAYDPNTVKRATRELVWLGRKALIILDRVQASAPAKWILHGEQGPTVGKDTFVFRGKESKLVGHTLLPADPKIRAMGSYEVDGANYPLSKKSEYHVAGGHRIEVSGGQTFLHVLVPTDSGSSVPKPKLLRKGGLGVEFMGRKVVFTRSGVKVK